MPSFLSDLKLPFPNRQDGQNPGVSRHVRWEVVPGIWAAVWEDSREPMLGFYRCTPFTPQNRVDGAPTPVEKCPLIITSLIHNFIATHQGNAK